METAEDEVYAQEGKEDSQKSCDGHDGCLPASPTHGQALVKQGCVE
jgi:hypothetical protein